MATDPLTISSHQCDGTVTVELGGELDLHGSARLVAAVRHALTYRPGAIDIDAAKLTFVDSAGLRTLLIALQEADAAGARLRIVKRSPAVEHILTMTDAGAALCDGWTPE